LPESKLVVHHEPIATCPASSVVVLRKSSASSLKVTFQPVVVVYPIAWGFQWILSWASDSETSPSMLIVLTALDVEPDSSGNLSRVWFVIMSTVGRKKAAESVERNIMIVWYFFILDSFLLFLC